MLIRNVWLPDLGVDYTGISLKANGTVHLWFVHSLYLSFCLNKKAYLEENLQVYFGAGGIALNLYINSLSKYTPS